MTRNKEISNEEKTEKIKNNLIQQVDKILQNTNEKSIKTRYRYHEGTERFCSFLAKEYRLQKFSNVKAKHFVAYSEYLKEKGYSASSIKTDLSGIRFFIDRSGNKNLIPDNKKLDLEKRHAGQLDRAWSKEEINTAINLSRSMGRTDISLAIKMASTYGMRLEEVCKCQVSHLKSAIETGELFIKGKNGQERYLHFKTKEQRDLAREILNYARENKRFGTDKVLYDSVKGSTLRMKRTIQNWVVNHRKKFEDSSRRNRESLQIEKKYAQEKGVKLKIETISFHGLRHSYAQQRYKYYRENGGSIIDAKKNVSEELGHHRQAITLIYLSEKPH